MELTTDQRFTKQQLPQILNAGYYITHQDWEPEEYLCMQDGILIDETGKKTTLSDFTGPEYEGSAWKLLEDSEEEEVEESESSEMTFEDAVEFMGEEPAGKKHLSDEQLEHIIALNRFGYSYRQIAPKFGYLGKNGGQTLSQAVSKYRQRKAL